MGVTVWCGVLDQESGVSRRGRPNGWRRGVSDAAGRLRFEGEPERCVLRGDGVDVLGAAEPYTDSGSARITVVPNFRCESAMVVVERQADWLLAWYRPAKGFSRVRTAPAQSLASSVRELWLEHGERRDPHDRVRDCAIVVMDSRPNEALPALAALTRPILEHHPDHDAGSVFRETELPALDTRVWSPDALCAWVATPLPAELVEAFPYGVNCRGVPGR
ncbi:MAG: hypothetical protein HYZ29_00500 [Myxococcales bacterium]|nr:hypothetical protein [Myxococcales bacterium]